MTDLPDDELVSAVLDDEATDEEVARVHSDAFLSARLAELRAARDAIAAPMSSPSTAQRDAAIDAAVASLPELTPVDLDHRRRHRALQLASIAAALLIVVGIVSAIAVLSNRGGSKAGSTTAAGPSLSSPPEEAVPGPASPSSTTTSVNADQAQAAAGGRAADSATDLGSFQTAQQLADALKAKFFNAASPTLNQGVASSPPTGVSPPGVSCESPPDATLVARAELAGRPVIVIVTFTGGQQTLEVHDLDCTLLFTQPL